MRLQCLVYDQAWLSKMNSQFIGRKNISNAFTDNGDTNNVATTYQVEKG